MGHKHTVIKNNSNGLARVCIFLSAAICIIGNKACAMAVNSLTVYNTIRNSLNIITKVIEPCMRCGIYNAIMLNTCLTAGRLADARITRIAIIVL